MDEMDRAARPAPFFAVKAAGYRGIFNDFIRR
jgi:hypothetical protein